MSSPPQILLLGAAGFIGQHIAFALRDAGYSVLACARSPRRLTAMGFDTLQADLTNPQTHCTQFWQPHLANCTHVINCAGLLTGPKASFAAVHVNAPKAVYRAMPKGGQVVLISAVGIDADTNFGHYRRQGEDVAKGFNATILRPGIVLADDCYGGSSLSRALAALPVVMPVVGDGKQQFNPIHADDLAAIIIEALQTPPPAEPIEIGGPEALSQTEMLSGLRSWLGLKPVRIFQIPLPVARIMGRIGDALHLAPISLTAVDQLEQGVAADTAKMGAHYKSRPRSFSDFQNAHPSQTQDLWHARLYLLRPVLRLSLALMWFISGLIGLFLPVENFLPVVSGLLPDNLLIATARIGGIIDLLIALALIMAWRLKPIAWLQFAMVAGYTVGLSIIAPTLWAEPFGGVLKNLPILVLILIHRVLEEER